MKKFSYKNFQIKKAKISGWGRRSFVNSKLINFRNNEDIKNFLKETKNLSCITRGLGRSYGDAAQLKNNHVLNLSFYDDIEVIGNEVTVGAGVSISELLKVIIPLGYILPVLPGSSKVTIGGAIAADVHGKNHYKSGSFGNHISKMKIIDGNGIFRELKPKEKKDNKPNKFFWATIGGMGLTGIILQATISLRKIETALMKVDTYKFNDLNSLMDFMKSCDKNYSYSVAWIDSLHKKGRGVLTCAEHALKKDLNNNYLNSSSYESKYLFKTPNFIPNGLLNKLTVKVLNELWFRKAFSLKNEIQDINKFFYPLDAIGDWNRIYGFSGFYQYQFVIPEKNKDFIFKALKKLKNSYSYSFITVLKRFGNSNQSYLSFPQPGWTLSVDLPANNKKILTVLNELDQELAELGGKVYLAKDLRQSSAIFKKTYIFYDYWKSIKNKMDPNNLFKSDLSLRLNI